MQCESGKPNCWSYLKLQAGAAPGMLQDRLVVAGFGGRGETESCPARALLRF